MLPEYRQLLDKAREKRQETRQYFARLRRKPPRTLDETVAEIHEAVFADTDCLACANCCKTTSPVFTDQDIARIAQYLRLRPAALVAAHLHLDGDGDYVLNTAPCTFLAPDNRCLIYEVRPRACRGYPHTDRKRFHQLLDLTLKNTEICPATQRIVEQLKAVLPLK
ncbi:MAG: YkgJ family cysteine cluster protein [Bacteroidia bacterium]